MSIVGDLDIALEQLSDTENPPDYVDLRRLAIEAIETLKEERKDAHERQQIVNELNSIMDGFGLIAGAGEPDAMQAAAALCWEIYWWRNCYRGSERVRERIRVERDKLKQRVLYLEHEQLNHADGCGCMDDEE